MIAIFDYGAGNLRSVQNTLGELGCEYTLVRDSAGLLAATKILLPGVGHFGQMMRALDALGVRQTLIERIHGRRALSRHLSRHAGVVRYQRRGPGSPRPRHLPRHGAALPIGARVPHMGWNELEVRPGSKLVHDLNARPYVYFAHSYYVPENDRASATCTYELRYTAALECGNVYGVQFHPEKSGAVGLKIVRNFLELA